MRNLAVLSLALAACGGGASRPTTPTATTESAGSAEDEARETVGEIYESLGRGDTQGILPLLGDPAFVAGASAAPGQVFVDRTAAVVALTDAYGKVKKHKVKSRALDVHAAPGGHAAWAIDKVDVDRDPYVAIAVLSGKDELWVVDAAAIAHPMSKDADAAAPPPLPVDAKPTPEIVPLIARFKDALAGRAQALAQLDDDAALVTDTGAVLSGADAIEKRWMPPKKKPHHHGKHHHGDPDDEAATPEAPPLTTLTLLGPPRAGLTPDGVLGWVCADVKVDDPDETAAPRRFFYVYQKRGATWRLVALAESAFPAS